MVKLVGNIYIYFRVTHEFILYLMLPGAAYCHWNLHITCCERYKKKMSKNVPKIVVKLNMFKKIPMSNLLPLSTLEIIKFGVFDFEVILVG